MAIVVIFGVMTTADKKSLPAPCVNSTFFLEIVVQDVRMIAFETQRCSLSRFSQSHFVFLHSTFVITITYKSTNADKFFIKKVGVYRTFLSKSVSLATSGSALVLSKVQFLKFPVS